MEPNKTFSGFKMPLGRLPDPKDIGYPYGMEHTMINVVKWFNTLSNNTTLYIFEPLFRLKEGLKSRQLMLETLWNPIREAEIKMFMEKALEDFHSRILHNEETVEFDRYNVSWGKLRYKLESEGKLMNINKYLDSKKRRK